MNSSKNSEQPDTTQQVSEPSDLELALEQHLTALEAEGSLFAFMRFMWTIVEPSRPFQEAWHLKAIALHLEAITRGPGHPEWIEGMSEDYFRNLLINIPPGHAKSLLVCVFWPAWVWIKWPGAKFLFASYSDALSTRDSIRCRDIIRSLKYKQAFGITWDLADDQDQKTRYANTAKGYRIATSVGGSGTGERADFITVDDPINAINAESVLYREAASFWWFQTMSTRDSDPRSSRRVCVMQRLHDKDLAGEIIQRGDYEHLCLPAEFVPGKSKATKIWKDPRTTEGELLWPESYGANQIAEKKKALGSRGYQGQFQQDPTPAEGGLFKRKWWKFYREKPMGQHMVVQFWDCAQKIGISNDYSVCATWMKTPNGYFLLDLWREKVEAPELERAVKMLYQKWSPQAVMIEDKSSGTSLIQNLQRSTTLPILKFDPGQKDKLIRASAATPTVESGNCFLPEQAKWLDDFIAEHEKFPKAEHDDQVDTTSMMVEHFSLANLSNPRVRTL